MLLLLNCMGVAVAHAPHDAPRPPIRVAIIGGGIGGAGMHLCIIEAGTL
jgi:glycerol-3-phosphate dehydrogenase